jgi:RNA polymerase sigma-70 factor (ECF subfamily)
MTEQVQRLYERVLVVRCQTGDEGAFAELVGLYTPRLRYYLAKMVGEHHAAEDVLQEVWLDVFRSLHCLADVGAFRAWVYRIAHDRACRLLRRRRPCLPLDEEVIGTDDEMTFSAEEAEWVHVALDGLSPEHREALVLRFVEGMAYEDIARVVGCPLGTVRSRLHHAKQALRRILEKRTNP